MAKNILVINCDIRETRVCLIEDGIIAELHIERESQKGSLGNIYLGKVSRVLPGMQAAFIDVGLDRAAFLHVEDLIRPDDFDAYLSGKRGHATSDDDRSYSPSAEEALEGEDADTDEAGAAADAAEPTDSAPPEATEKKPGRRRRSRRSSKRDAAPIDDLVAEEASADTDDASELVSDADDDAPHELDDAGDAGDDDLDGAGDAGDDEPEDALEDHDEGDDDPHDDDADDDEFPEDATDDDDVSEDDDAADDARDTAPIDDVEAVAVEADDESASDADDRGDGGADDDDEKRPSARRRTRRRRSTKKSDDAEAAPEPTSDEQEEVAAASAEEEGDRPRKRRSRRSGKTKDRQPAEDEVQLTSSHAKPAKRARRRRSSDDAGPNRGRTSDRGSSAPRGGNRSSRGRGRPSGRTKNDPLRLSKTTPIRDVVREGQEVLVQVSKEPIGTKGARVTSHISLPGRYVVYLPTVEHVGISKRIGSEKERGRLREAIEAMKPPSGGLIVRTLAEGLTKKSLKNDVGYLVRLWGEVAKKREGARAPECLYTELDLVLKTARDLFTEDIEKIVVDDREEYLRLRRFVELFMPERADAIEYYDGQEPIFDAYGIEDEIGRALSRKVPLPSGGHLIIDEAEALTAIDVNTGRYVGKGSKDLEDTILTTNLEAVEEIAYQLRFRNIGGLIILDLIDMERSSNREKVRRKLEQLLSRDKAKTTLNRISDLGLIEMTRKRTRESLGRLMNEPCFYCDGTGQVQSKQSIAYEILRQIRRERANLLGYTVVVNAHPAVVDVLKNEERDAVVGAERMYMRRIELIPRREYHIEQYDLQGK